MAKGRQFVPSKSQEGNWVSVLPQTTVCLLSTSKWLIDRVAWVGFATAIEAGQLAAHGFLFSEVRPYDLTTTLIWFRRNFRCHITNEPRVYFSFDTASGRVLLLLWLEQQYGGSFAMSITRRSNFPLNSFPRSQAHNILLREAQMHFTFQNPCSAIVLHTLFLKTMIMAGLEYTHSRLENRLPDFPRERDSTRGVDGWRGEMSFTLNLVCVVLRGYLQRFTS